MTQKSSFRPIFVTVVVGATIIAIGLAIGLAVGLRKDDDDNEARDNKNEYKSAYGVYPHAAVAADSKICSDIGKEVLARIRGNAIDAGVATLLCIGATSPHSGGIGGGSFAVLYHKNKGWSAVDFREAAPAAATANMYYEPEDRQKSSLGGMAVAIPGELLGAVEIHARYGVIPWKSLVKPTINLLQNGFPLPEPLNKALHIVIPKLQNKSGFGDFLDADGEIKPVGSIIKMPKLANTFQILADDPMSFYNGSLAQDIVNDINDAGGIFQLKDLQNYKVLFKQPTEITLPGKMKLYSMPAPGSGPVLSYILSILAGYNMSPDSISTEKNTILTYHRIVEAMKFAYAKRSSLGDEDFVDIAALVANLTSRSYGDMTRQRISDVKTQEVSYYNPAFQNVDDKGTSHLSVVDGEGNAIAITSTVNHYFGSKVIGSRTGIIFNNEMDDFSTPNVTNYFGLRPSKSNFIEPGKRPQSSMSPTIVWDDNNNKVSIVIGAAGGSKITTATALSIIGSLWFNMSVPQVIDMPRLHHQLLPNTIWEEEDFDPKIKAGLEKKGHKFQDPSGISVVQMLRVFEDNVVAVCDYRKGGEPSGF